MKKIIILLFAILTMTSAMAQSDYTYLDAVKALTETNSLKTLGEKGYELKKEAKGATHELFYVKGKMYLGEDYEWHGKDDASSLVRVTYLDNVMKSIDIIYTSLQSIESSFDELRFSKPQAMGEDTEGTDKVFKFQTEQLNVTVEVPENHETATFHIEKK
jgi:hypothetical protein